MDLSEVDRISTAGVARRGNRFFAALRRSGTSIGESWEFPGGKNRLDERPEETLLREYQEEFCVDITVGNLLYEGSFKNKGKSYGLLAYAVEFVDEDPEFCLPEHQKVSWLTLEELFRLPMAGSDRAILDALSEAYPEA